MKVRAARLGFVTVAIAVLVLVFASTAADAGFFGGIFRSGWFVDPCCY